MAASKSDKTSFSSTASTSSSLSALSSETPDEFKCQDSIDPALVQMCRKQSAVENARARTIVFLGHEGSGKAMAVDAMAKYLKEQKGYAHPSVTTKLFKDELGFNMAVDELHFEEGMTMVHFPDKWDRVKAASEACESHHIAAFKKEFSRKYPRIDAIFLVLKLTKDFNTMKHNRNQMLMSVLDLFDGQDVADNTFILLTTQDKGAKMTSKDLRTRVRDLCCTDDCDGISYIVDGFEFDATAVPIKSSWYWFADESDASVTDTSALAIRNASVFKDICCRLRVLTPAPTLRGHPSAKAAKKGRRTMAERSKFLMVVQNKILDTEAKNDE